MMKKLLIATDGSKYSEHAASIAKDFLQAWPELELIVCYVTVKENYAYDLIPDAVDRFEEQITKQIEKEAMENWFASWNDRVKFLHATGHPSISICEVAEQEQVEMIIVGSHGRGAIDRMLLGSVAHGVLHRSKKPVLVVR
jgi:nucleotide-binding universal stress UspA family protein